MSAIAMPEFSMELALLVGRAVFLVFCFLIAAVTFTRWRRAADRSTAHVGELTATLLERLASLEARLESTQACCADIGEKIASLGGTPAAGVTASSYQIAIRLARAGATRDELIRTCAITRQEAELVQRLHAPAPPLRIAAANG
jgi:hypothetical protein